MAQKQPGPCREKSLKWKVKKALSVYDRLGVIRTAAQESGLSAHMVSAIVARTGRRLPGRTVCVDQAKVCEHYKATKCLRETAVFFNVHFTTVRRIVLDNGYSLAPRASTLDAKQIRELRAKGMKWKDVGFLVKANPDRLRTFRLQNGLTNDRHTEFSHRKIKKMYDDNKDIGLIMHSSGLSRQHIRNVLIKFGLIEKRETLPTVPVETASRLLAQGWTLSHVGKQLGFSYHRLRKALIKHGHSFKRLTYKDIDLNKSTELFVAGHALWMVGVILCCSAEHIKKQWKSNGIIIDHLRRSRSATTRTQRRILRQLFLKKFGHRIRKPPSPVQGNIVHKKVPRRVRANGVSYLISDFPDTEKLRMIVKHVRCCYYGVYLPKSQQRRFVSKAYHDPIYNKLIDLWRKHERNMWWRPSVDHIIPMAKGGKHVIANIQFMTRFENLMKSDRTMKEWNLFKQKTETRSHLFLDAILSKGSSR